MFSMSAAHLKISFSDQVPTNPWLLERVATREELPDQIPTNSADRDLHYIYCCF